MNKVITMVFLAATISSAFASSMDSTSFAVTEYGTQSATGDAASVALSPSGAEFSETIEDNSYFIEEAYNQEPGVVQHISNIVYFSKPMRNVAYSFTQEWPVGSQAHQFSLTIPYSFLNSNTINGVGDIFVNYRYQLFGSDDWAAVSPRLSVIVPSGNADKGLGSGVTGYQFNLPVSKRLSENFAAHFNSGFTIQPNVKEIDGAGIEVKRTLTAYNIGASVIYLAAANVNLMLEYVANFTGEIDENGDVIRSSEHIVSPGVRFAITVGELQIVPGLAVPFSISESENRMGMFFYLSFEHPF